MAKKVKIISVGVSSDIDYRELNEISNGKAANVIHVEKFEDPMHSELHVKLNKNVGCTEIILRNN